MKFANNIFVIAFCGTLNLLAMEVQEPMDICPSQLETQIFGRRIRVENQTGYRILLKICKRDSCVLKIVLENNSSADIGPVSDIPESVTYELYGDVAGWAYAGSVGTISFCEFGRFEHLPQDKCVLIKVKKISMLRWYNDVEISEVSCRKNELLPNLFPSVEFYMKSGYFQRGSYETLDDFQSKNSINFSRYVLGLSRDYSEDDVRNRCDRLCKEWNPDLYEQDQRDLICKIIHYVRSARNVLLVLSSSTIEALRQLPSAIHEELFTVLGQYIEENAELKEQLRLKRDAPPPPPPFPAKALIPVKREYAWPEVVVEEYANCNHVVQVRHGMRAVGHQVISSAELLEGTKSLRVSSMRNAQSAGLAHDSKDISPERWREVMASPELLTQKEMIVVKYKYESESLDLNFLQNLKLFIEQITDVDKFGMLLNYLDRGGSSLVMKKKIILGKISEKIGRGALARDIKGGGKLRRVVNL